MAIHMCSSNHMNELPELSDNTAVYSEVRARTESFKRALGCRMWLQVFMTAIS